MDFNWAECPNLMKLTHGITLSNPHNECFLNAVLQFVFHTPQLVRYIKFKMRKSTCNKCEKCVYCILDKYLLTIEDQLEELDPTEMKDFVDMHFPQRVPGRQEDAHEMLTFLLDQLNAPTVFLATRVKPWFKMADKNNGSNQLIKGEFISNIMCHACKDFRSSKPEKFQELNLDLHRVNKENTPPADQNRKLEQYIKAYFSPELLGDYKCQNCSEKRVYRKILLTSSPALLIIQLKRFGSNGKKDMTNIDIPLELNLDDYFEKPHERKKLGKPPADYRLYGYISHLGESIQNGHYISTFLGYDSEWYLYDNASVKSTYPCTTSIHQPYLLFYYRSGVKGPSRKLLNPLLIPPKRPQSSVSQTSLRSSYSNATLKSRRSLNITHMSSDSQLSNRNLSRKSFDGPWWSSNNSSSDPQKQPLHNQFNSFDDSQDSPPSPKRSCNPWEALTDDSYYQEDDEDSSRF